MSPVVERQSRAQAGLAPPTRTPARVSPGEVVGFTVHHTAGPSTQTPAAIQHFHQHGRGWVDVGYARLVVDNGDHAVIVEGRGYGAELAHALGHNRSHVGVAVIGTYDTALPSAHALAAVAICHAEAEEWAGKSLTPGGHRDLMATNCPGDALHTWTVSGMDVDENATGGNAMQGLAHGDSGPRVEQLQTRLRHAGFAELLGPYGPRQDGVDGEYGDGTEAAVLAARHYVNSGATSGARVTGPAAAQIERAATRRDIERALDGLDLTEGNC